MMIVGRTALTESVLVSQPIYHMTTLKMPDEILKSIDKARRKFLWTGGDGKMASQEDVCKVNCKKCADPRISGDWTGTRYAALV